jgi:serine/threonine protein kinase
MQVNKKAYARLDMIGKGGSSRVFRVLNHANELYAIKRVSLDKTDAETMSGYMNEIALLKRLEGNSRIIRLIDSEVKAGPGGSRGHLLLVMECGEVDLARLMSERGGEVLDMVWVAYYWQQVGVGVFGSCFCVLCFSCVVVADVVLGSLADAASGACHPRGEDRALGLEARKLCVSERTAQAHRFRDRQCYCE